ncbi:MAG: tRNA lysidine(34) synthetase TilS [Actinomycetota bacterium]
MLPRPPAVARVLERVTATVRANEMFAPGDRVLVAVSGGPDSVCLLESLVRLRRLFRISIEVFHYDHRLRPDSGKDAEYVRRLAARHRLVFHPCEAYERPGHGVSVEEWARDQRRTAGIAVLTEIGGAKIAWGHTVDDQAETVLMRVLQGGGLDSVAGIRPITGPHVRPLLDVLRVEVEAFCRSLRLRPRLDPTNRDRRFARNAVRLDVLPAIERATGREVRRPLARTASLLARDRDELDAQARDETAALFGRRVLASLGREQEVRFAASQIRSLSPAIASRVIANVLHAFRAGRVTSEDLEGVRDLAVGRPGRRRDLSGGLLARRSGSYIVLVRPSPHSPRGGTGHGSSDH